MQIYAQQVTAPGQPVAPIVLVGEAVADATGMYTVTVGQYVLPTPPVTIPNLNDGQYTITAVQYDVAGNLSQQQSFGNPGTVVIDGTDANDHGYYDPATGTNMDGWFYIQEAVDNIGQNVQNGNKLLVALGATPTLSDGTAGNGGRFGGTGNAGGAIRRAFEKSSLPGQGWSMVYVTGTQNISDYLSGLPVTGQVYVNSVLTNVPNVRISSTGLLYITTVNQASGDIGDNGRDPTNGQAQLAIINQHGVDIANFVNAGGGLFSQAEPVLALRRRWRQRTAGLRLAHVDLPGHHGHPGQRRHAQRHRDHPAGSAGLPGSERRRPPDRPLAQLLRRQPRAADDAGHRHRLGRRHRAADPHLGRRPAQQPLVVTIDTHIATPTWPSSRPAIATSPSPTPSATLSSSAATATSSPTSLLRPST